MSLDTTTDHWGHVLDSFLVRICVEGDFNYKLMQVSIPQTRMARVRYTSRGVNYIARARRYNRLAILRRAAYRSLRRYPARRSRVIWTRPRVHPWSVRTYIRR